MKPNVSLRSFVSFCRKTRSCPYVYALAREGKKPSERLTLGLDVPQEEAAGRVMRMLSALYADEKDMDDAQNRELCRLSAWAFRSAVAGKNAAMLGVMLLNMLKTEEAHQTMLDALTDPMVNDALKYTLMQVLTAEGAFVPYNVDIGGRLVKLAASGTARTQEGGEAAPGDRSGGFGCADAGFSAGTARAFAAVYRLFGAVWSAACAGKGSVRSGT